MFREVSVWPKWYSKLSAGRAKTRPQNPSSCLPHCPSSVSSLGVFLWNLGCFAQIPPTQTSAHFDSEPKKWELNSALLPPIWVTYKDIDLAGSLASQLLSTRRRQSSAAQLQYSCLENPMDGGAWWAAVHGVAKSRTRLSDFTFTFRFLALEKEMATHSSTLAWRIPGTGEPGGLLSVGSHRVGHDWNDLAAAVVRAFSICLCGDWILCCCSCWPALKGVQGGEWGTLCSRETGGTGL